MRFALQQEFNGRCTARKGSTERNNSKIMNCFYHPTRPAVATCVSCQKGLCPSCVQTEKDVRVDSAMSYCPSCASDVRRRVEHHNMGVAFFGTLAVCFLLIVARILFGWSDTVFIIALVLAGVLGLAGMLIWAIVKVSALRCPVCGAKRPVFRVPKNIGQALGGGWTCSTCGAESDRYGHLHR